MRPSTAVATPPLLDTSVFTQLARFRAAAAVRAQSVAQIRILDAWIESWLPRLDHGTSAELLARCDEVMGAFHEGCIVPPEGPASGYPMDEYVAALDLARASARSLAPIRLPRAPRRRVGENVTLHTRLPSIARALAERRAAFGRQACVADESDTGFAIDLATADAALIRPGELACLCREGQPTLLARVMRIAPLGAARRVRLGLRRISSGIQPVVIPLRGHGPTSPEAVILVPHASEPRHDGLLLSQRMHDTAARIGVQTHARDFVLRLRRVRERGAGWVLCGFEVEGPAAP